MRRVGKVLTPRSSIVDVTAVSDGGFAALAGPSRIAAARTTINVIEAICMRLLFIFWTLLRFLKKRGRHPWTICPGTTASECFGQPVKLPKKSLEHKLDIRAR